MSSHPLLTCLIASWRIRRAYVSICCVPMSGILTVICVRKQFIQDWMVWISVNLVFECKWNCWLADPMAPVTASICCWRARLFGSNSINWLDCIFETIFKTSTGSIVGDKFKPAVVGNWRWRGQFNARLCTYKVGKGSDRDRCVKGVRLVN